MTKSTENVNRIEPTRIEGPTEVISDLVAELAAATTALESKLHPRTAANLAVLVRIMNTYYSNLIEGHNTRPKEIEKAMVGALESNQERRSLQLEARAHMRVQAEIDRLHTADVLPDPTSIDFIKKLHREFYQDAPKELLLIKGVNHEFIMKPGQWRSMPEHDVSVGRHIPPSSERVDSFMVFFADCFDQNKLSGKTAKMIAIAAAHHRFNYIHPFPDGNGRVSRLMSHAMCHKAGIGANGLWSISRGLARGINSRSEYKTMMDLADSPRQGDFDGRGNLSKGALIEFVEWFLKVCLDQVKFMSYLFELNTLARRLRIYVERSDVMKHEAIRLLEETLFRGEIERGEVPRILGMPERSARRVFNDVIATGLLGSDTPKGPVSLRFPTETLEYLFPALFPNT